MQRKTIGMLGAIIWAGFASAQEAGTPVTMVDAAGVLFMGEVDKKGVAFGQTMKGDQCEGSEVADSAEKSTLSIKCEDNWSFTITYGSPAPNKVVGGGQDSAGKKYYVQRDQQGIVVVQLR